MSPPHATLSNEPAGRLLTKDDTLTVTVYQAYKDA